MNLTDILTRVDQEIEGIEQEIMYRESHDQDPEDYREDLDFWVSAGEYLARMQDLLES